MTDCGRAGGDAEGGNSSCDGGPGVQSPENFLSFTCKILHSDAILGENLVLHRFRSNICSFRYMLCYNVHLTCKTEAGTLSILFYV